MRAFLLAVVIGACLGAIAAILIGTSDAGAVSCHHTRSQFGAPDNACTPGRGRILPRALVCQTKDRPDIRAATRRVVLGQYGVPGWTGASGEIDHRWPVFLGGATVEDNLWPEPGPATNNPKDALERLVRSRVCGGPVGYHPERATMRVRTGVRIFLSDWRDAYCRLVDSTPSVCRRFS